MARQLIPSSPVITLSPGGRKFRKPLRLSMDASVFTRAHLEAEGSKVRVFCSMSVAEDGGGWEDITDKIGLQGRISQDRTLEMRNKVALQRLQYMHAM